MSVEGTQFFLQNFTMFARGWRGRSRTKTQGLAQADFQRKTRKELGPADKEGGRFKGYSLFMKHFKV